MDNVDMFNGLTSRILVLSADCIEGEVRGTSVIYTFNTTLDPVINSSTSFGQKAAKVWGDVELFRKINHAPALYDGKFIMRVGSDGKPTLRLVDLDFVSCGRFMPDPVAAE